MLQAIRHDYNVDLTLSHFADLALAAADVVKLFDVRLISPPHAYDWMYEKPVRGHVKATLFID